MVLLPKQVHLQKDVGAGIVSSAWLTVIRGETHMQRGTVTEKRKRPRRPESISSWLRWQLYSRAPGRWMRRWLLGALTGSARSPMQVVALLTRTRQHWYSAMFRRGH